MYVLGNSKKGQTAIEFLILVMTMLFLFVLLFYFVDSKVSDVKREALVDSLKEVAFTVQEEISLADGSIDGYKREFFLPQTINGFSYLISIEENYVYIRTTNGKNALALPINPVSGDVRIGSNWIRKENGVITLN